MVAIKIFAAAMSELYRKSASHKRGSAKQLAAEKLLQQKS